MNGYQYTDGSYDGNGMQQDGQQDMLSQQNMMMMGQGNMNGAGDSGTPGGQSLDEIVNMNNMNTNMNGKLMRRQSMPQGYQNATQNQNGNFNNPGMRRMNSMMEFNGSRSPADAMSTYPFNPAMSANQNGSMSGNSTPAQGAQVPIQSRRQSGNAELNLSTNYPSNSQNYASMMPTSSSYASPAHPTGLDMDMNSPYLDPSLNMQMDYSLDPNDMGNSMGSMGGNMPGTMGGNMGANMSASMGQMTNMANMATSMANNMNNMVNSMGGNVGQNVGQNMNQNMGHNMGQNMGNMGAAMGNMADIDTNGSMSGSMSSNMGNAMASNADNLQVPMYNQRQFNQNMATSPMHPGTPQGRPVGPPRAPSQVSGNGSHNGSMSQRPSLQHQLSRQSSQPFAAASPQHSGNNATGEIQNNGRPTTERQQSTSAGFQGQIQNPQPGSTQDRGMGRVTDGYDGINGPVPMKPRDYNPNNQNFPWTPEGGSWPSTMVGKPHMDSAYKNAYSSTGFDMLGVLVRGFIHFSSRTGLTGIPDASCNTTKPRDQHWLSRLVVRVRRLRCRT